VKVEAGRDNILLSQRLKHLILVKHINY